MAKKYLDHDIPEGRRSLIECRDNLMGISDYCEQNYASANNKRKALEVTQVSVIFYSNEIWNIYVEKRFIFQVKKVVFF